jgi:hypothetical protein
LTSGCAATSPIAATPIVPAGHQGLIPLAAVVIDIHTRGKT